MTPPFPFVGAGEASYFEWADLHVHFTRPPKPREREKIVAGVPPPLADSCDWSGAHLYAASEQGVGRVIEAAYAKPPKRPTKVTTTSRFKMASRARVARFNADIERWLAEAHAVVPVLVAYRRQDAEAGGTKLSAWHEASVGEVPAIVKALGKPAKGSALATMVQGLRAEHAAHTKKGPTVAERIHELRGALMASPPRGKAFEARANRALEDIAALDDPQAWWRAADAIADDCVVCHRNANLLAQKPILAIALRVFERALTGTTPEAHAAAFQFRIDEGYQPWRLQRIMAVALECALRAGDRAFFAHVAKGTATASEVQLRELERCAAALDERKLEDLASKLRALGVRR
ncbi:MAG: hypothetical protein JST00_05015 [Deltaproteobacteria bacterium]|nr:hypothetical protein [Deltaproteobacteria bacterium]